MSSTTMERKRVSSQPTNQMFGRIEVFGPDEAAAALASSPGNRIIRDHRVQRYIRARESGNWYVHHQGLAFNENDQLIDGHHRLTMVIRCGLPTSFFVVRNVPSSAAHEIDGMLPRSTKDAFHMSGQGDYGHAEISVASHLYELPKLCNVKHSRDEIRDRLILHGDAIQFACRPKAKGLTRGARIAIARAYMAGADRDRLNQFCDCIVSGLPESPQSEQDYAALTYGKFLSRTPTSNEMETEKYRKGQTAIRAFLDRQPATKLYGTADDLFPLPDSAA